MANAEKTMQPESFAAVMATVDEVDGTPEEATTKVDVLLTQANKLHKLRDMVFAEPGHRYNSLDQFSMVLALVLGTAGLPHILNRYYTNPSGAAARRSTFWVLVFIGIFYILSPIVGLAARSIIFDASAAGTYTATAPLVDGFLVKPDQLMPTIAQLLGRRLAHGYRHRRRVRGDVLHDRRSAHRRGIGHRPRCLREVRQQERL